MKSSLPLTLFVSTISTVATPDCNPSAIQASTGLLLRERRCCVPLAGLAEVDSAVAERIDAFLIPNSENNETRKKAVDKHIIEAVVVVIVSQNNQDNRPCFSIVANGQVMGRSPSIIHQQDAKIEIRPADQVFWGIGYTPKSQVSSLPRLVLTTCMCAARFRALTAFSYSCLLFHFLVPPRRFVHWTIEAV